MRGAWSIIERAYPKIQANGCAAHVMNLVIQDICKFEVNDRILREALTMTKFIRNHQAVKSEFDKIKASLHLTKTLVMPVPTRWYTQYNCIDRLLDNKNAITLLCNSPNFICYKADFAVG